MKETRCGECGKGLPKVYVLTIPVKGGLIHKCVDCYWDKVFEKKWPAPIYEGKQ